MPNGTPEKSGSGFIFQVLGPKRGEYAAVAWSFLFFFCVLSAYYMLRSVRETMGVGSGHMSLPWLFSATFVVMLIATTVFGFIASRYPRRVFLPWVYFFFIANIMIFWLLFAWALEAERSYVWTGRAFFVWLSIFNLFVVSVFWSFMADIYTHEQGRRLFGFISAGGSLGALLGPLGTAALVVPIGFQNLLPISAALLLFATVCITQLRRWVSAEHRDDVEETAAGSKALGGSALAGFSHVFGSKYFTAILIGSVIASLMGTALYMFMNYLVGQTIASPDEQTRLFALVDAATNAIAMIGQLLVVRQSVRFLGIGLTLCLLPIVSLAGFFLLALTPTLVVVAVLQAVRRGIGFGFTKPVTDMLYSVVTPEEKYKAKNFIDTAGYRGGDLVGIWSVTAIWALGISGIALVMLPFAVIWAMLGLFLGREYRRRDAPENGVPVNAQ